MTEIIGTWDTMKRMYQEEEEESDAPFAVFLVIHWYLTQRLWCELTKHKDGRKNRNPNFPGLTSMYCLRCHVITRVEEDDV